METDLDLLTEAEAAELLLMSPKTLQKRRFNKKPPKYLCLNGTIRYRMPEYEGRTLFGLPQDPPLLHTALILW